MPLDCSDSGAHSVSPNTITRGSHAQVAFGACATCDRIGARSGIDGGFRFHSRVPSPEHCRARRRYGRRNRRRDGRNGRNGRCRHGRHDRRRHRGHGRRYGWKGWRNNGVRLRAGGRAGTNRIRNRSGRRRRAAQPILSLRHALRPMLTGGIARLVAPGFGVHLLHRTYRQDKVMIRLS